MAREIASEHTLPTGKYPWDTWFNGSIWELSPDEDFATTISSFRTVAYRAATIRGGTLRTRSHKGRLLLQYFPPK